MTSYYNYAKEVENYNNQIDMKEATKTARTGRAGLRDKLVFGKAAWSEALTYFAIVQTAVIFLGLVDDVINNVNSGIKALASFVGIVDPFQFPVDIAAFGAVFFIIFILIFGVVGYRYLGLPRRTQEIGSKMNASMFLIWDKLDSIQKEVSELKTQNTKKQ